MSAVEHSHTSTVCDLCWLPGVEIDRSGKVFAIRGNSAGTSAQVRTGGSLTSLLRLGPPDATGCGTVQAGDVQPVRSALGSMY
jgi:hypothetical protein